MSSHYKSLTRRTNPEVVPIFPLNGAVLLPACDLPLNIFEPRYLNMIDDALKNDRLIGMVQSQDKKLAKITWPLWFYVAVTGPVVYWFIAPYYA